MGKGSGTQSWYVLCFLSHIILLLQQASHATTDRSLSGYRNTKDYPVTGKDFNKIHWGSPTKLYFKRTSSTCYRDKATIANGNDVIPGYRLRVFGVGVCDQRTNATPRCQHVSSSHCAEPKISQSQAGTDGYLPHIPPAVFVAPPPSRHAL